MRGKANGAKLEVFRVGITPAYAGKSAVHSEATPNNRDHPRVCGEKKACCFHVCHCTGSPPRMRGKDNQLGDSSNDLRITPACAGKSVRRENSSS